MLILRILITLFLVFIAVCVGDAFYGAVVIGGQFAQASIGSIGATMILYTFVFIAIITAIVVTWKNK